MIQFNELLFLRLFAVSPPRMVETPRLPGEEKVVVVWSRAAVQIWGAHEDGPEGPLGVAAEDES
jgi:hypothetical protein